MIAQRLRNIIRITAGCIVLLFGIAWVYEWGALFYEYRFSSKLFLIMLLDYLVVMQLLIGMLLIVMSWYIFKRRIKARAGLSAVLLIFLITWLIVWQMLR